MGDPLRDSIETKNNSKKILSWKLKKNIVGTSSVLNEIAELTQLSFYLEQTFIPLNDAVEGACEMLRLDPLYVANEGVFLAIVDAEIAERVVKFMHNDEKGKYAVCIGEITEEHPNKVVMQSAIGGKRIVSPMIGEQLPRIC